MQTTTSTILGSTAVGLQYQTHFHCKTRLFQGQTVRQGHFYTWALSLVGGKFFSFFIILTISSEQKGMSVPLPRRADRKVVK